MTTRLSIIGRRACVLVAALLLAAPAIRADAPVTQPDPSAASVPPAPAMDGWSLQSEALIPREQIAGIESKLHGKISALRNATYLVNNKKIQINVIVPADASQGEQIFHTLSSMKAAWSVARRPEAIYEFVGQNDSSDDIKKAQAILTAR